MITSFKTFCLISDHNTQKVTVLSWAQLQPHKTAQIFRTDINYLTRTEYKIHIQTSSHLRGLLINSRADHKSHTFPFTGLPHNQSVPNHQHQPHNTNLILKLLWATRFPKVAAVTHCKGHQFDTGLIVLGSNAGREARRAVTH